MHLFPPTMFAVIIAAGAILGSDRIVASLDAGQADQYAEAGDGTPSVEGSQLSMLAKGSVPLDESKVAVVVTDPTILAGQRDLQAVLYSETMTPRPLVVRVATNRESRAQSKDSASSPSSGEIETPPFDYAMLLPARLAPDPDLGPWRPRP